jgi:hypothetical protein
MTFVYLSVDVIDSDVDHLWSDEIWPWKKEDSILHRVSSVRQNQALELLPKGIRDTVAIYLHQPSEVCN